MEPLFREGDSVSVACGPLDALQAGDLICFRRGTALVMHRLIERGDDGAWFEKGDAEACGSWIDPADVVGRVTRLNGEPFKDAYRLQALRCGRTERRLSGWLNRMGLPRMPVRWAEAWRRGKTRWLQRTSSG